MKLKSLLKTLLAGALIYVGFCEPVLAQKLRFPTDVRYVAGGYTDKQPYFSTLEAALNNVKPYATALRPFMLWVDGDTVNIADWDSVFTESGLTMKDSIDIYYINTGKIKWGPIGFGGAGGGSTVVLIVPDRQTAHYFYPTWIIGAYGAIWDSLGIAFDSIDQNIWDLIVYTKGCIEIVNDTLTIDYDCLNDSVVSWIGIQLDSNRVVRKDVNNTLKAVYTLTGSIAAASNGYFQVGTVRPNVARVLYGNTNRPYYSRTGSNGAQDSLVMFSDLPDTVYINRWFNTSIQADTPATKTLLVEDIAYTFNRLKGTPYAYSGTWTVTDSSITVGTAGVYLVNCSVSHAYNDGTETFNGALYINNTLQPTGIFWTDRTLSSTDIHTGSFSTILSLAANDILKLKFICTTASAEIVIIYSANLTLTKVY